MITFEFIKPKLISLKPATTALALKKDINKKKLFAVGEIHGVAQNADLYFSIFNKFDFETIALEYPVDCQSELLKFLKTGEYPKHWFFQEINDGRFNFEMLSVLKQLFEEKKLKAIICYDKRNNTPDWNVRDKDYADAFIEQYNPNLKTLIIGGGYHTKTEPFTSEHEKGVLYPMCYHLKELYGDFPTSQIIYTDGEFYNFGKQIFELSNLSINNENLIHDKKYKYSVILSGVKTIKH